MSATLNSINGGVEYRRLMIIGCGQRQRWLFHRRCARAERGERDQDQRVRLLATAVAAEDGAGWRGLETAILPRVARRCAAFLPALFAPIGRRVGVSSCGDVHILAAGIMAEGPSKRWLARWNAHARASVASPFVYHVTKSERRRVTADNWRVRRAAARSRAICSHARHVSLMWQRRVISYGAEKRRMAIVIGRVWRLRPRFLQATFAAFFFVSSVALAMKRERNRRMAAADQNLYLISPGLVEAPLFKY